MGFDQSVQQTGYSQSPYYTSDASMSPYSSTDDMNRMLATQQSNNLPIGMNSQPTRVAQAAQAANMPQAAPMPAAQPPAEPEKPKKRGFFGTIGKMLSSPGKVLKGMTVGLVKSVANSLKDWKTWLMIGVGVAAMFIPGGQVIGAGLLAYGVTQAAVGMGKSGMAAYQCYSNGMDEAGDKAMEDLGTSMGALGLSAVGAKGMVKGGAVPTSYVSKGMKLKVPGVKAGTSNAAASQGKVVALKPGAGYGSSLVYVTRYGTHATWNGAKNIVLKKNWPNNKAWLTEQKVAIQNKGVINYAKDNWQANSAGMAANVETQRLNGWRTPITSSGDDGITVAASASDSTLVKALDGNAKSRQLQNQSGETLSYSKSAIQQELAKRGLVQIKDANGKTVWKTRQEATQMLDDARAAQNLPALERRLEVSQKALTRLQEQYTKAQNSGADTTQIAKQIKAQEGRVAEAKGNVSKAQGKINGLTKSVEREVSQPAKAGAATYAQIESRIQANKTRAAQLEKEAADAKAKVSGAPTQDALNQSRTTAQKALDDHNATLDAKVTAAKQGKTGDDAVTAETAAREAHANAAKPLQDKVDKLQKQQSKDDFKAIADNKLNEANALKASNTELSAKLNKADDTIKTPGQQASRELAAIEQLQARQGVQNAYESSMKEALAQVDDAAKPHVARVETITKNAGYSEASTATLILKSSAVKELSEILNRNRNTPFAKLPADVQARIGKLHEEAGLGKVNPDTIMSKTADFTQLSTATNTAAGQVFSKLSTEAKQGIADKINAANPSAGVKADSLTLSQVKTNGVQQNQAEALATAQKSYNTTTAGNTNLPHGGKAAIMGAGAGIAANNSEGTALQDYLTNYNPYGDMGMDPSMMGQQQNPWQNVAVGDAYIRGSDMNFMQGMQAQQAYGQQMPNQSNYGLMA